MDSLLQIHNKGQQIVSTNYWDSERAQNGFMFLSWNAGAARLLVPDNQTSLLAEIQRAREVIISRGPMVDYNNRDALELLFEDDTDAPYCVHLGIEQSDRVLPETDQGGGFAVAVWTRAGLRQCWPGRYRNVAALPCAESWVEN